MSTPPRVPSSCWESVTAALSRPSRPPSLQEQLLAHSAAASDDHRAAIERLREQADALQRELDGVVGETEVVQAATRRAEARALEAAAELQATARAKEAHEEMLRMLEKEIKAKDARITMLEAIVATITPK